MDSGVGQNDDVRQRNVACDAVNAPPSSLRRPVSQDVIAALQAQFGSAVSTTPSVLEHHGRDESWHAAAAPDAVVFPTSTEDVAAIVRICSTHRVPVIAFGAGTSLEGHVLATRGGVCVDMTRMNRICALQVEDLD